MNWAESERVSKSRVEEMLTWLQDSVGEKPKSLRAEGPSWQAWVWRTHVPWRELPHCSVTGGLWLLNSIGKPCHFIHVRSGVCWVQFGPELKLLETGMRILMFWNYRIMNIRRILRYSSLSLSLSLYIYIYIYIYMKKRLDNGASQTTEYY